MSTARVATIRRRLLGLGLIVVLVGLVGLSIALYEKAFTSVVTVKLKADRVGNQLINKSDVKVRGLIVGTVDRIEATATGSELTLALKPEWAKLIPANVTARFLPKTLFGERFVSLEIPPRPSGETLRDGSVIPQDRTSNAIEVETALQHLMPVLQAVQPQKLNSTLTAISTALEGRGKPLGEMLTELGTYIGDLNPHVPTLQENLRQLAAFSDNLADAAPQLLGALDNLRTTSGTIVDQQQKLRSMYANLTVASVDLQSFLQANADNLIGLAATARPTAELLAKYSPEYPCVLKQMAGTVPKIDQALGKGTGKPGLRATLEITANRGPYRPGQDEPRFEDKRGPRCYEMDKFPMPFPQHPPDGPIKDGSTVPPASRSVNDGLLPPGMAAKVAGGGAAGGNPANTPAEHNLLAQLVGPQVGLDPAAVPGWTGLLVGPLYRGAEVTLR